MTPGEQFPDLTPANLGDSFVDPASLDRPVTFAPTVEPLHLGRRIWAAAKDWRGLVILGVALAFVIWS